MAGTVQVFVDLGGPDAIPHVFIGITDNAGVTTYSGYAPATMGVPVGQGKVFSGTDPKASRAGHMDQVAWASEEYDVSDEQIKAMNTMIAHWKDNPGTYVGMGDNCGTFVHAVLKAGDVDYPMAGLTNHPASFIPWPDKPKFFKDNDGDPATGGHLTDIALHPANYPGTPAYEYVHGVA